MKFEINKYSWRRLEAREGRKLKEPVMLRFFGRRLVQFVVMQHVERFALFRLQVVERGEVIVSQGSGKRLVSGRPKGNRVETKVRAVNQSRLIDRQQVRNLLGKVDILVIVGAEFEEFGAQPSCITRLHFELLLPVGKKGRTGGREVIQSVDEIVSTAASV